MQIAFKLQVLGSYCEPRIHVTSTGIDKKHDGNLLQCRHGGANIRWLFRGGEKMEGTGTDWTEEGESTFDPDTSFLPQLAGTLPRARVLSGG